MKKLLSLLAAVSLSFSAMAATSFVFNNQDAVSQSADGVSVSLDKGTGSNAPYFGNNGMRLYAGNTITVSGDSIALVQIVFAKQGTKAYAELSVSGGTLTSGGQSTSEEDLKIDTWSGETASVVFTLGTSGQRLIKQLVVNGDSVIITPTDTTQTEDSTSLDPEYKYAEPTAVTVPAQTVQGAAYTFVCNNIEVKATKGAITPDYFSCHAGEKITFTATQAIKGIVIDGYVKKDFEATASSGTISYVNASADEVTANPVVVITDIDTTAVTLSCVKQLRCYGVKVYFEANPTDTIAGGQSGTGEVFLLEFNTADAVYESEWSEVGNYNYTVYLYADSADIPYIGLDLYTAVLDSLVGVHELGEYSFYQYGEGDIDYTYNVEGAVAITQEAGIYTISGYMTCDDKNTYNFSFQGELPFYIDTEYYSEEEAIENIPALNNDAAMYDILGRPVGKGYKGFVIQNGNKYLLR